MYVYTYVCRLLVSLSVKCGGVRLLLCCLPPPPKVSHHLFIYLHVFLSYALDFLFYPPNVTTKRRRGTTAQYNWHRQARVHSPPQKKERKKDGLMG